MADPRIHIRRAAGFLRRGQEKVAHRQCRTARAAAQHPLFVTRLPSGAPLGRMRTRVVRRYGAGGVARYAPCPWAGGAQIRHRPYVLDLRLFRHEAPSHHHRGADQCHAPRHGARRGHARFRRAADRLPVGRRLTGTRVALHAEPFEPPRRGRFRAQRLDTLHRPGRRHGCRQRAVRQIYHGAPRPGLRAKLVQPLPILHDGRPDCRGMVAEAARLRAFPLELGHPADLGIPVAGRLRLPHGPARSRRHDFRRVDGAPRLGRGFVRLRCPALPRTEPACQGRRSRPHPGRHGLPVARVAVACVPGAAVYCVGPSPS